MADPNDNNGNQGPQLMDLPPDNQDNANKPQLSPSIIDDNQPQLSPLVTDLNQPQLSPSLLNPAGGDNGNQPSLNPNTPPINPNTPPLNPNQLPSNPNQPPLNPNLAPLNPNVPPFIPNQPLLNPSSTSPVQSDDTNQNQQTSQNGNKPLSSRVADLQLSDSGNRNEQSLAERRFRRRSGNGNQSQELFNIGAVGGTASSPSPSSPRLSERRSRKRSSSSFSQPEPIPPASPRLAEVRGQELANPPTHLPPRSPRLVERANTPLTPDTEENVASQTEGVFRNFAYQMYTNDTRLSQEMEATTPALPELTSFTDDPLSQAARVGRQLAQIGDDLDKRYNSEFSELINLLNITPDTAYESFAGIARKVFYDGRITWSRVVTLLCFAYRMGINVLRRGIRGFFSRIVQYLCRFVVAEKIAQWIADQGGWVAALRIVPETVGWPLIAFIIGLAGAAVFTSIFLGRR